MTRLVGKPDNLILNRRAVPRTDALNLTTVQRGAGDVLAAAFMRLRRGVSDVAGYLRPLDLIGNKRERSWLRIACLRFEAAPIDGPPIQPRRRPSFQPLPVQTQVRS